MQQYDKMILAILQGDDYHDAVHSLNEHGFYATVLNSSGGFLKKRSVTLMIGLESARLDEALAILKKHGERTEMRYEAPVLSPNMPPIPLSTAPLSISSAWQAKSEWVRGLRPLRMDQAISATPMPRSSPS